MIEFKHLNNCGHCGGKLVFDNPSHYTCDSCDQHTFNSPVGGSTIVVFRGDTVLLNVRAIEPRKGSHDTIGGFIDFMEDPKATAAREFREETGGVIVNIELIDVITLQYTKNQSVLDIFYLADIDESSVELMPADDVAELVWLPVADLQKTSLELKKIPVIRKAYARHLQRST